MKIRDIGRCLCAYERIGMILAGGADEDILIQPVTDDIMKKTTEEVYDGLNDKSKKSSQTDLTHAGRYSCNKPAWGERGIPIKLICEMRQR